MLPALTVIITVLLAFVAVGFWQPAPYDFDGEDARGTNISGLYNPVSNEFEGTTRVVYPSGLNYEGAFKDHRFNGYGVFKGESTGDDGEPFSWRFEGTFEDGHLEGEGSYIDHLGSYEGDFVKSLPQGQGVYTSNSGWSYAGEFVAGMMTGEGTVTFADGNTASGTFEDGLEVKAQ